MQQPSAQGIASLYRGNPQPLQQSIQKEQQAKPGLPPDLQKMLALQIVNNEKDGVTAQKAMDQLRQMAGSQGTPPTVMQSLEQQAAQKLQAQAVQAQQKQQGIQALMQQAPAGAVPEGTPEPAMQPEAQGIDQLPADFEMAEGGIVAFSTGGDVDSARAQAKAARERLQSYGLAQRNADPAGYEAAQAAVAAASAKLQAAEAAYAKEMSEQGMDRPAQVAGMPKAKPRLPVPEAAPPSEGIAAAANRTALNKADAATYAAPAEPKPPVAPARDIKTLAAQIKPAPAAAPEAKPEGSTAEAYAKYMNRALTADRDAERAKEEDRYAAVGKQDLSQYDRLIAELDKRKAEFNAPAGGFDRLAEYLGEVAKGGRGRKWYEAGAAGSASLSELDKSRKTQQFELTKQGVEIAQKKLDADRAFNLDKYKAGQEGAKRIDDIAKDAAKEFGLDARNERTLANQIKVQLLANQGALARGASGMGAESKEIVAAEAAFARDPEAKALMKTMEAYAMMPDNPKAIKAAARLREIQAAKYAQFGLKMEPAPGAPKGPGGTNQQGWSIKPLQ
jgi:hypothetical protein